MSSPRLALALALAAAVRSDGTSVLRVLRTTPGDDASPASSITITFDRPVAGSLDYSVAADTILKVTPAIPGRIEWRDPVTIRLTPRAALTPNATYTVSVANSFRAMDGSRLSQPYTFTFRVRGPTALTGTPAGPDRYAEYLAEDPRFEVIYSAAVDPALLTKAAFLEFDATCQGPRVVRLKVLGQRPIGEKDDWRYREAGGWQRQRSADTLRRVVQLAAAERLTPGCRGMLRVPVEMDEELTKPLTSWPLAVHGQLKIVSAGCSEAYCPTGPASISFSTPVRGLDLARFAKLLPAADLTVRDSAGERSTWPLEARLRPHTTYAIVIDTGIRDIFGQRLTGNPAIGIKTTGYEPAIEYPYGRLVVERNGFRTLAVQSINVDTLVATIIPIPDTLEAGWLSRSAWGYGDLWAKARQAGIATVQRVAVSAPEDRGLVTGLRLPVANAQRPHAPTLMAVKVQTRLGAADSAADAPIALVQVTDLAVHARVGVDEGVVWVTGVSDGLARAGALVTLYDDHGRDIAHATTDSSGVARLTGFHGAATDNAAAEEEGVEEEGYSSFEGYVGVLLGSDRAVTPISQYDPDLSPWRFNVYSASNDQRAPMAGAVFTERGIYRPGETVYAKAIARDGALGALSVPQRGDSLRWMFRDREEGTLKTATTPLSAFGTATQTLTIPASAPLGYYQVEVQRKHGGAWRRLASASYRVAEYRPPEFLVQMSSDSAPHFPGDTIRPVVQARYLFGAPMGRAVVSWTARQGPAWWLAIPKADGFEFGDNGWWWEDMSNAPRVNVFASGTDTLDLTGHRPLAVALPAPERGRASTITVEATVTDVNRQVVGASIYTTVHPASFYVGVHPLGQSWFWTQGTPVSIEVIAARTDGTRIPGIAVSGMVVRREWHQVRRDRDGISELVGDWVSDTVANCAVTTAAAPVTCGFTPPGGGEYTVTLRANDERGRPVVTSLHRWATGKDWVPWNDESQFKMDVIPDKTRYSVGDTASVLFASPFTDAEAWVTVEREGILEQRRLRLTSGATRLTFPITEAYTPNAYVSIIVARGRSAPPGPRDDPGRPTIRVGYAELRVTPEVKRLKVDVQPVKQEFRPGDTARVRLKVKDTQGRGRRSEVTLWAVDEGVLALTGYKTPDPIDLLYAERGLGLRLASNLVSVAPQMPEGLKGKREPGGGGGSDASGVLRTRFQTTAFFLGSVITDSSGSATAAARLPDNLTTFRVMAVAVTAGDRYGKGESPMLVTRPLIARPALPRFVRATDEFAAGTVVNQRAGGTPTVTVSATAEGITLTGPPSQTATLEAGRGREVRFGFRALPGAASIPVASGDSATFRFRVTDGTNADAVQLRLPIKPEYHPRSHTIAGVLRDSATATFVLPGDIDPERSRLSLSVGTSPLTVIRAAYWQLKVYPYYCSEQVSSAARVLIALYKVQQVIGASGSADSIVRGDPKHEIEKAVATLSARQRTDGGIGFWSATDWTTPWLSAYAGAVLVDAKGAGIAVDDSVLARLATYLGDAMRSPKTLLVPVSSYYDDRSTSLGDQVAAADLLSRMGKGDRPTENSLLRLAPQMAFEDRLRLAELMARRGAMKTARDLLAPAWALAKIEGRRASLPDSLRGPFYFESRLRPVARLLVATLAVDSTHPLIAPLVETLSQIGRVETGGYWYWNTQDLASAVSALAAFEQKTRGAGARHVRVRGGGRLLLDVAGRTGTAVTVVRPGAAPRPNALRAPSDSIVSLHGLVTDGPDGTRRLTLSLDTPGDSSAGVAYYFLTVGEVPLKRPVTPDQAGIQVDRWYENYETGKPVTSVVEGDLVRVRLRLTVPADREFVVLDDALPAGLEAVDLSLRTSALGAGPGAAAREGGGDQEELRNESGGGEWWYYGWWDGGWWSPFDHREIRDDRVVYFATRLWPGSYSATYIARATTPGVFVRPPAHAEEMYNPAVHGRSDGGVFTVIRKK